jgi:hypothetical protein
VFQDCVAQEHGKKFDEMDFVASVSQAIKVAALGILCVFASTGLDK